MKVKNLLLIALLFSIAVLQISSISLISKYQTRDLKIKEILNDIVKSEKYWNYDNLKLELMTKSIETAHHGAESLKLSEFKYIASFLSSSGLVGKFDIKENHKNNTLEITSSKEMEGVYDLSIEFRYDYLADYKNGTIQEFNGKGIIYTKSQKFNVTLVYTYPDYEVIYLVDVDLNYLEHSLEEDHQRISLILTDLLQENDFEHINNQVSEIIRVSLEKWEIEKEDAKLFELTRKFPKKSYNVSYRESLAFDFDTTGVISLMEGDIEGQGLIYEEDSEFRAFRNFDPLLAPEQLFIHKKILTNLFKLGAEKKLVTIRQENIDDLKPKGLKRLDIESLVKFFPEVSNKKPLDSEFYIEYYVDSVSYKYHDAYVNFIFFFVSYDEEVLLKLNFAYNVILEHLEDVETGIGAMSINFFIRDRRSFVLRDVKIISPLSTRINKSGLIEFLDDVLHLSYEKRNYILLNDFVTFDKLIEKFDTVKPTNDGFILYHTLKKDNLKFLN
jgi:hypothetical protein